MPDEPALHRDRVHARTRATAQENLENHESIAYMEEMIHCGRTPMRTARWVVGLALCTGVSAVIAACGGASQPSPQTAANYEPAVTSRATSEVHKRGDKKLIAEVGPPGGTLELSNGARLTIPVGALSETVEITFSEGARTTAFANHEYERTIGPTLEIGPEASLSAPVQVSVPLASLPEGFGEKDLTLGLEVPSENQRLEMQGVQTRWDYLPAQSRSGRAVAEINSVPGYRVQFLVSKND